MLAYNEGCRRARQGHSSANTSGQNLFDSSKSRKDRSRGFDDEKTRMTREREREQRRRRK